MGKVTLIKQLRSSNLVAECNRCGEEFKLRDALIFDGLGEFPELAEKTRLRMEDNLQLRIGELKNRKISVEDAEKRAISVGIGKIIEKVVAAYREFKIPSTDCRALFEPIDMIVFRGITNQLVDSITFLDVKTGSARLNPHQRMIRNAIEDKNVKYLEV